MSTSGGSSASNVPQPSATVVGPDALGSPAAPGVAATFSRGDHDHGLPSVSVPTPATAVTGPDAFGAAAVVGTSTNYARQDHNHGLPANPVPGFAAPTIALGTAAGAGVAGTIIRSDATIVAFDTTAPVSQAFGDAAGVGTAAVAARRDHRHGMPANPAPSPATTVVGPDVMGTTASVGTSVLYARADHDHGLPGAGAWTTYTPTIRGTGWVLGNGTLIGRYRQLDAKTIAVFIAFQVGSTTTVGTGLLTFDLPANANLPSIGSQVLGGWANGSVLSYSFGLVGWDAASNVRPMTPNPTTPGGWSTTGFNPSTNQEVMLNGVYEAA